MTQGKAKKNAIRQRMAETGERYNVARRSLEPAAADPVDHLISDDETRRIAVNFLASSPWIGDVKWREIIIGPGVEYLTDWGGFFDPDTELSEGQRWSWSVSLTDPTGQQQTLSHEVVLEGLRGLIFGEAPAGPDSVRLLRLKQWFTEPAVGRRKLDLGASDSSRICQQALYERKVFSTEDEELGFGKFDLFEDQRPAQDGS